MEIINRHSPSGFKGPRAPAGDTTSSSNFCCRDLSFCCTCTVHLQGLAAGLVSGVLEGETWAGQHVKCAGRLGAAQTYSTALVSVLQSPSVALQVP